MRVLVLGAGGIGGYYGARIQAAGGDVTFLVRPGRAEQLKRDGINVFSPFGDLHLPARVETRETLNFSYDVIIVSCKAFDLDSAMDSIAPAVGKGSVILPLLNGVRHIDALVARFGAEHVLGGVAAISVTLALNGDVQHLNKMHRFITGARGEPAPAVLAPLAQLLATAGFDFVLSNNIDQALWDKFVFLTSLAGATCTMRASVGQIMGTVAGEAFLNGLLDECAAVAAASGHTLAEAQLGAYRGQLTDKSSGLMASMLRDVEKGGPTEADHILGDMVARAKALGVATPNLCLAYSHLQAYDLRRKAG